MFLEIRIAILLLFLIITSYTDIKERIVPDKLVYAFIAIGLLLNLYEQDFFSIGLGAAIFILGLAAYYTGVFGGGDIKAFAGIVLILPFYEGHLFFIHNLILAALFTLTFYSIYYSSKLFLNKKIDLSKSKKELAFGALFTFLLAVNFYLLSSFFSLQQLLIFFIPMFSAMPFMIFQKQIKKEFFLRNISLSKLDEDEVIALEFLPESFPASIKKNFLLKKVITDSDKKLLKKKGIDSVPVFQHMPAFMPMVLLSAIVILINPDVLSILVL